MKRLRNWWRETRRWRHCPHEHVRGIYGDEIIFGTPNWNRLQCLDCGNFLDGPASIALNRRTAKGGERGE